MELRMKRLAAAGVFSLSLACGGGSAPATEPEPTADSEGDETEPTPVAEEAPPPEPMSSLRVIHASSDPAVASVSIALDARSEPLIASLGYRTSSGYTPASAGHHSVVVRGPGADGEEGPTLALASEELEPEHTFTAVFVNQEVADSPFTIFASEDVPAPPAEGEADIRFFHALIGSDDVDVCVAGATARADATTLFADVALNAFGATAGHQFATVPAEGEVVVQLRASSTPICHGRVAGVARFTPTSGTSYTLVAIGRTSGHPRVDREMLICPDAPADGSCTVVPIAAR
jgi:hypothetical protein